MNIYEVLHDIVNNNKHRLSSSMFFEDKKNSLDTDIDRKLFDLIKNICSLALKISAKDVEFHPHLVWEGRRTFAIEDLTEDDYTLLNTIDFARVPSIIKARLADILWVQKKDYTAAKIASNTYFELFNLLFNNELEFDAINMIKRAICISVQINHQVLYNNCCQTVYDHIMKLDVKNIDFVSISLVEIMIAQSFGDFNKIIDIIDGIITYNKDNPIIIEQAYILKTKCLNKLKKTELSRQANIDLADYFVGFAEDRLKKDATEAFRVDYFLKKAIQIYGNNEETEKAQLTHKRLVEVQKDIPNTMHPISFSFDGDKIKQLVTQAMNGLTFEEALIQLTQMVSFYTKEEMKQKVIKDIKEHPLQQFFPNSFLNEKGQTIFKLPRLDLSNLEGNQSALDLHIHRKMFEHEEISGNTILYFAFSHIKKSFNIKQEDFDFLVKDNAIIPKGRNNVIRFALYLAFSGHYYESLHILAPQIENVFRNIAIEVGGLTVKLKAEGTSEEKPLSSIFDIPELNDCYNNDILFMFKGLLNEKAGANIRNEIAHGIMSEEQGNSGASLFFICAVTRLLALYSRRCHEIIANNRRTLSDKKLNSDDTPDSLLYEVDRKDS